MSANFKCAYCDKVFTRNTSVRRHIKSLHSASLTSLPSLKRGRKLTVEPQKALNCSDCGASFSHRKNLLRHRRIIHKHCQQREFQRNQRATDVQKLEFSNLADFMKWKHTVENESTSTFVRHRKDSNISGFIRRAYYCHRSGRERTRGRGVRHARVQGSCKSGVFCPAAVFIRIAATGGVRVSYYSQHAGHDHDIAHQQITHEQRAHIAGMLSVGIPLEDVLDRVQLNDDSARLSRLHLLNKQDLKNIARDFNISHGHRFCANDADSVAAWVEANRQDGDRCLVRYIKFQGTLDEVRNLRADDFCLVIISEAQIAGLQQMYRPHCEVAMDSTHGTNAYDFQLTTVMLVDDHGEGFPAAFCFSNRVDEQVMTVFLRVCMENFGVALNNVILMTDDTEVYTNAWTQVMGQPAYHLLCTWHIDRAWRKNLAKVRGDNVLKATVYKTLRALLEVTDISVFGEKLAQFLESAKADDRTAQFGYYFEREYASRPNLWAYCHRLGLKVHHNMHLEALHRVLKHVHMNGRKVRRMDSCIHALLRLMRMKMRDRLQKIHKGKWTSHVRGIRMRHQKAQLLDTSLLTEVEPNRVFAVQGRDKTVAYMVEQSDTVPHDTKLCPLECTYCGVCVHSFVCNCVDFGLRNTICKHIHAVVSTFKPAITCRPSAQMLNDAGNSEMNVATCTAGDRALGCDDVDVFEEVVAVTTREVQLDESTAILQSLLCRSDATNATSSTIDHYLREADETWSSIRAEITGNVDVAAAACQQLKRMKAYLAAYRQQPQLPQLAPVHEPANKKLEQQRYFASTKKLSRKRKPEASLSKPSSSEKSYLLETLAGNVEVVSSAPLIDHDYDATPSSQVAFEHSY